MIATTPRGRSVIFTQEYLAGRDASHVQSLYFLTTLKKLKGFAKETF